ncbi:Hypp1224 [Branchiostoma lanceolatum]|uniref:Hypp1224 protein n=1 Tax=Branchiostoma lanceolatum TaxID=7740 RepID=A0A8J9ZFH2_BRALA|nr:Hypp1224 [Branchiostoma lanceolatum]
MRHEPAQGNGLLPSTSRLAAAPLSTFLSGAYLPGAPTAHLAVLTCDRALSPGSSPEISTHLRLWSSAHLKTQVNPDPDQSNGPYRDVAEGSSRLQEPQEGRIGFGTACGGREVQRGG